jgi:hypothetical protein
MLKKEEEAEGERKTKLLEWKLQLEIVFPLLFIRLFYYIIIFFCSCYFCLNSCRLNYASMYLNSLLILYVKIIFYFRILF